MARQSLTATTTPLNDEQPSSSFEMSPRQLSLFKDTLTRRQRCERYDVTCPSTPKKRDEGGLPDR